MNKEIHAAGLGSRLHGSRWLHFTLGPAAEQGGDSVVCPDWDLEETSLTRHHKFTVLRQSWQPPHLLGLPGRQTLSLTSTLTCLGEKT